MCWNCMHPALVITTFWKWAAAALFWIVVGFILCFLVPEITKSDYHHPVSHQHTRGQPIQWSHLWEHPPSSQPQPPVKQPALTTPSSPCLLFNSSPWPHQSFHSDSLYFSQSILLTSLPSQPQFHRPSRSKHFLTPVLFAFSSYLPGKALVLGLTMFCSLSACTWVANIAGECPLADTLQHNKAHCF